MDIESEECLYRYSDCLVSTGHDEWGESTGSRVEVRLEKWPIRKRTPKGAWIGHSEFTKQFVRLTARKRFACETIDEARESFIARKRRQLKILSAQLKNAERALLIIEGRDPNLIFR